MTLALLLVGLLFLTILMATVGGSAGVAQGFGGFSCTASAAGQLQIPPPNLPLYQQAAARFQLDDYGVWVLAGIHFNETRFGTGPVQSSAFADGPMQFLPVTWRKGSPEQTTTLVVPPTNDIKDGLATDGDGDGRADINNLSDAVHAAARYLNASGAPADYRKAIFAYNHSTEYVDNVIEAAERFRGDCTPVAPAGGAPVQAAAIAGSPKNIIDTVVLPLSNQMGVPRTVAQNDAANAAHGPTISGGHSDHQGPPNARWAADMSNGQVPTPEMDRLARALADTFGIPWSGSGLAEAQHGTYRYQLIYRTTEGGWHYDHVHFGVAVDAAP